MRKILEKYVPLLFSFIILGGLLWGLKGIGQLTQNNYNIVNLLTRPYQKAEGLIYLLIGLCTLTKFIYNIVWDRPKDPPHIIFILFIVILSGLHWGVIGLGILFNTHFDIIENILGVNSISVGIINYTIGILTLLKLFNYIYNYKHDFSKKGSNR